MKNLSVLFALILYLYCPLTTTSTYAMPSRVIENGTPDIKSMHALTFGPEAVLFIGDSKSAKIFAIETKDVQKPNGDVEIEVTKIDHLIAESLGTEVENITIQDMAINPISKRIYLAVHHVDGTPVLLTLKGGSLEHFNLKDVTYSEVTLDNPVSATAQDRRGRSLRRWAISDLDYHKGKVLVSGLSNKEFSSSMTMLSYPFDGGEQDLATLEIWHAAHGKYETHAPIKTFTAAEIGGKTQVIASYTCTPLVLFPLDMMKEGQHVKGRTIAELGNRNTPLDMIVMENEGKKYLLMSNTSRALMKISFENLAAFDQSLTEPVTENSGTAGIDFIALPLVNVLQMDKLDDSRFVLLQRKSNGNLDLVTGTADRWL